MPESTPSWSYATPEPLAARIALHAKYGTAREPWHRWVFDRMDLRPGATVLEVGCGPGTIWARNADRLPPDVRLTLTDRSPGMVEAARRMLGETGIEATVAVADAARLPFAEATFDVVLAAHMLYHVEDRARAIAEARRVLRPGGRFVATTNGRAHLRELEAFACGHVAGWVPPAPTLAFGLEHGEAQLRASFRDVSLSRHEGGLVVPHAEPLLAYLCSLPGLDALPFADVARLRAALEAHVGAHGALRITTDSGAFVAR
ncbi:MAG: methyltransferase domain-containing protein [Planctomycetia bacterium]|nr:methyltransferase domain-containing protein [Planctomycetia bacterium]